MTEYDYSPEAVERHLRKQAGIADWVEATKKHKPINPFMPIAGETTPSATCHYPQLQPHQTYSHPQPAFYATPQGIISPTFASTSKKHRPKHKHSHHSSSASHHTSGTQSLRPSPPPATPGLPISTAVAYAPVPQRSRSTPPTMPSTTQMTLVNGVMVPGTMTTGQSYFAYPAYQQQLSPPLMVQPRMQGHSYPYPTPPVPVVAPAPSRSSSHSKSRPPSVHSSRSHQLPSNQYPSNLPVHPSTPVQNSNMPVVVPINDGRGGYVILPAGQNAQVLVTREIVNVKFS